MSEERMRALDEFIADFEAEHGTITEADMRDAQRWARKRAIVVDARLGRQSWVGPGTRIEAVPVPVRQSQIISAAGAAPDDLALLR